MEESLPGDQIGQGRPGEGGHDHQVGDGLEREPQAAGLPGQEVAEGHRQEVADPGQDGDHDGHPAHGQGVVAPPRRHRREGRPLVGTPLPPPGLCCVRCLACAHAPASSRPRSVVHRRPSRWPPTRRLERRNGSLLSVEEDHEPRASHGRLPVVPSLRRTLWLVSGRPGVRRRRDQCIWLPGTPVGQFRGRPGGCVSRAPPRRIFR